QRTVNAAFVHSAGTNVPLIPSRERSEFTRTFKELIQKDAFQAIGLLNSKLAQAGDAAVGENSYRRAIAIDLASGDKSMAYIVQAADVSFELQERMLTAATN